MLSVLWTTTKIRLSIHLPTCLYHLCMQRDIVNTSLLTCTDSHAVESGDYVKLLVIPRQTWWHIQYMLWNGIVWGRHDLINILSYRNEMCLFPFTEEQLGHHYSSAVFNHILRMFGTGKRPYDMTAISVEFLNHWLRYHWKHELSLG